MTDVRHLPRVSLLNGTALEPMQRLSTLIGHSSLYLKRDDDGGRGGGLPLLFTYDDLFTPAAEHGGAHSGVALQ